MKEFRNMSGEKTLNIKQHLMGNVTKNKCPNKTTSTGRDDRTDSDRNCTIIFRCKGS